MDRFREMPLMNVAKCHYETWWNNIINGLAEKAYELKGNSCLMDFVTYIGSIIT